MDLLLLSYLHSPLESERERLLSELMLVRAAPVIRHTLRLRLNFYVDHTGASPNNPEAEDLYHDIIAKLIERLNEAKGDPERQEIRDFRQYVARVAVNACNDYLRGRSPARSRLKNNLRDLLDRHPDFLLWRGARLIYPRSIRTGYSSMLTLPVSGCSTVALTGSRSA